MIKLFLEFIGMALEMVPFQGRGSKEVRMEKKALAGKLAAIMMLLAALLGIAGVSSEPSSNITSGLVAHWKFDEGEGDILFDDTENNNDGVVHGATWVVTKFGYALMFDGVSNYILVPDSPSLNPTHQLTLAAWIQYRPTSSPTQAILTKRDRAKKQGYALEVAGGRLRLRLYDGEVEYSATGDIVPVDEWTHVAVTWDGASIRFYLNGEISTQEPLPFSGSISPTTRAVNIGRWSDYPNKFLWAGLISEVSIWDRALTEEEIQVLYERGKGE